MISQTKKRGIKMKYFTFKLATARLCAVCLGICVLFGSLCLTGAFSVLGNDVLSASAKEKNADTSDKRIVFLQSYGWEILEEPLITKEITIPKSFDPVYTRYNTDIQLPEGFDLSRYKGKTATLYCYKVINYPYDDEVYANILVCNGQVIGGDICSVRLDGFMHGFTPPDGITLPS